ncbi:immunoglobulin domain-containing family protein [Streptomyces luteolus]|uniref:Secreted protein n=1 Tax=Streptomyces luteolus TaxID=3043615 RepID=A0ABT6T4L4_9ACTN|nr:hypothetical protein [Streptomyces sp. B-S-A12]MDI3422801.1 hypothetical protein [Streptomyces sp. B-S-A12]
MSAFLQQLPALIGVVVGAFGSYLAVTLGDRARFRREQMARWEDRRLTAYTEHSRALKAMISVLFRVSAHFGNDPHPHPLAPAEAAPRLSSASEARDQAWETMLLLAAPEVVDVAHTWARTVAEMERFLGEETHDPDEWSTLLRNQRVARERFYTAARLDVSLPTGHPGRFDAPPGP